MSGRLHTLCFAVALPLVVAATPALAQSAPAAVEYPGGTTAVAAPQLPASEDLAARTAWIAECGRRLDAVNEGRDGPEPFRTTCAAWLDYFQRSGVRAKEAYANPPVIPVTMVPLRVMVPCKPAMAAPHLHTIRYQRHDKRVRID